MNFQQLRSIREASRRGYNLTEVANVLFTSQPGVSRQIRELEEELGIETRPGCYLPIGFTSHSYESFHMIMPLFACRMWKGEITPKEHKALQWVRPREMFDIPMPAADIPLIHQLEAQI